MSRTPPLAVEPHVVLYAMRYALGRQTFAATIAAEAVLVNLHRLPVGVRQTIAHDVGRAVAERGGLYPMVSDTDRPAWDRVLDAVTALPEVEDILVTSAAGTVFTATVRWADGTTTEGTSTTSGYAVTQAVDVKREEAARRVRTAKEGRGGQADPRRPARPADESEGARDPA